MWWVFPCGDPAVPALFHGTATQPHYGYNIYLFVTTRTRFCTFVLLASARSAYVVMELTYYYR